jgi:hypothetical protein
MEIIHVKWVPCHHDMVQPQVADGEDGLQISSVAENILNMQSQRAAIHRIKEAIRGKKCIE